MACSFAAVLQTGRTQMKMKNLMPRKNVSGIGHVLDAIRSERCVLCGGRTDVRKRAPISARYGYVEGAGQLCRTCYRALYVQN